MLDIVSSEEVSRGVNVDVNACVGSGVAVASRQKALLPLLDQINSRGSQYNRSVSVADSRVHHTTFFVRRGGQEGKGAHAHAHAVLSLVAGQELEGHSAEPVASFHRQRSNTSAAPPTSLARTRARAPRLSRSATRCFIDTFYLSRSLPSDPTRTLSREAR